MLFLTDPVLCSTVMEPFCCRKETLKKITGTKTILNLKTQNVNFSIINDIPKDDLVFNMPYQPVRVYGNLEVTQLLHVHGNVDLLPEGTVGDIDLSEQILLPGREYNGTVHEEYASLFTFTKCLS